MRITVRQLHNLIKEEFENALFESYLDPDEGGRTIKRVGDNLYVWTDEGEWQIMGPVKGTKYESLAPGKTANVSADDPVLIPAVQRPGPAPVSDRMRMPSGDPIYPGGRGSRTRF